MDREEFALRVSARRNQLYRTAYLYLGREADALEAVDEAVYQALRHLRQLREEQYFETWLTRILLNECHRELRRRKRLAGEEALPESAGPDAYDGLPLREAVSRLPEELRQVVILRFFADRTLAETAECLGLPVGTVSTRQRKALQLLRLELGEEERAGREWRNTRPCGKRWRRCRRPWRPLRNERWQGKRLAGRKSVSGAFPWGASPPASPSSCCW